jgi:poly(A) polymerase
VDALILSGKAEVSQLKELQNWSRPVFPLNGKDAVTLGFSPDAAMGKALKAVEAWWVEADFAPSREACLAELARQSRT